MNDAVPSDVETDPIPIEDSASGLRRRSHLARAALVGLISGLLAVGFRDALYGVEVLRDRLVATLHLHPAWGWMVLPAAALGLGSLAGWLVTRFAPDAPGSGIPHVKAVMLGLRPMGWKLLIPIKFVGGLIGIGGGLALGAKARPCRWARPSGAVWPSYCASRARPCRSC
ncbi:MAG: chloride channel protein [Tepidisphaeraceae bacterium]